MTDKPIAPSPEPRSKCPTCKSYKPEIRNRLLNLYPSPLCLDKWHEPGDSQSGVQPDPDVTELKAAWTEWLASLYLLHNSITSHGEPISMEFVRLANAVGKFTGRAGSSPAPPNCPFCGITMSTNGALAEGVFACDNRDCKAPQYTTGGGRNDGE